MIQETIKYFCDCCDKEIPKNRVNKINISLKTYEYFYNGLGESLSCFEICNDCMKKLKLSDTEKTRERFIQMLKANR